MATILGSPVSFGFSGTDGIAESTTLTGKIILQSIDYSKAAEEDQVRTAAGDLTTRSFFNTHKKATLEYISTGAEISTARTNTTVPAIGTLLNISKSAAGQGATHEVKHEHK